MNQQPADLEGWMMFSERILLLEQQGFVKRTFRRLDPDRQVEIVDAILYEAGEKGVKNIGVSEVANRAGVAVGSMYQYFPNRQGMIDFAIELSVYFLIEAIEAFRPFTAEIPVYDALLIFVKSGVEMSRTQQGMLRFYGRAAYQGDPDLSERVVKPVADSLYRLVRDIIVNGKRRGEIRENIDEDAVSRLINGMLIMIGDCQLFPYLNNYLNITGEEVNFERILKVFVELLQSGIGKNSTIE